jgi:hypothetical protein
MGANRVTQLLQLIAVRASEAQDAIGNGDNTTCYELLSMIEIDSAEARKEMESLLESDKGSHMP